MDANFNNHPYLRPIDLKPHGGIEVGAITIEFITEPNTGMEIPYEMSYEMILSISSSSSTVDLPAVGPTLESSKLQAGFINLKHHCIRSGELINNQLKQFLKDYDNLKVQMPSKLDLNNKDFSQLRDLLGDIIKKDDRFWGIEIFNSAEKRKLFRRTFAEFIEDRNIYTHGHLTVRIDNLKVVIKYRKKGEESDSTCEVNEQIIHSYFQTYLILRTTISEMAAIVTNSKK